MNKAIKFFSAVVGLNVALLIWLFLVDHSDQSLQLWARYTARISFVYFILAFSAGSLNHFLPNTITGSIRRNRRYLGLSFAIGHTVHLVALASFVADSNEDQDIISLIGGGLAYLAVYVMAFTSSDKAVKKLGPKRWKKIHSLAANYIGVIFAYTYFGRLLAGEGNFTFSLLLSLVVASFVLRAAYTLRSKNSIAKTGV